MEITRGKIEGAQKVVIYGPEGIGKSTFAAQFPDPVFIDTEGSTKHMDVARLPKPTSWTMLMEQIKYIKAHPDTCKTLVIDTADWAEQLCITHVCSKKDGVNGIEDFGYGKGYTYLAEEWGRFLNALTEIIERRINIVITAHAKMRKFEQPDETGAYDRWELKLSKTTAPLLKEWADMVLFANYKTLVVNVDNQGATKGKNKAQGGRRVMHAAHHPCWDAKNRHGLPDEMSFEYKQIAHCIPGKATDSKKETVAEPQKEEKAPTKDRIRYWHHPESECVFMTNTEAEAAEYAAEGHCVEVDKAQYEQIKSQYESEPSMPEEAPPPPDIAPPDDFDGVPQALADLMRNDSATVQEVQAAVSSKGYYPNDTPISNYDPGFIQGVLIGAWTQVFGMIKELREVNNKFKEAI